MLGKIFKTMNELKERREIAVMVNKVLFSKGISENENLTAIYTDDLIKISKEIARTTKVYSFERGKSELVFEFYLNVERYHPGKWVAHLQKVYQNILEQEYWEEDKFIPLDALPYDQ